MLTFLEFFAGELRERRKRLGLGLEHRALLLCDQATQHSSKKFEALKQRWMEQHNVESWILIYDLYGFMMYVCVTCVYIYILSLSFQFLFFCFHFH